MQKNEFNDYAETIRHAIPGHIVVATLVQKQTGTRRVLRRGSDPRTGESRVTNVPMYRYYMEAIHPLTGEVWRFDQFRTSSKWAMEHSGAKDWVEGRLLIDLAREADIERVKRYGDSAKRYVQHAILELKRGGGYDKLLGDLRELQVRLDLAVATTGA